MRYAQDECARELLDAVPSIMRFIRTEMRSHRDLSLSVPQFRALVFIERAGETSLGSVAEHLGLTPPSACRLVDGLEARGLVTRAQSSDDRRRVDIQMTVAGKRSLGEARRQTRQSLSRVLSALEPEALEAIAASLGRLKEIFADRTGAERRAMIHADA